MKTIDDINTELDRLRDDTKNLHSKREREKIAKKCSVLYLCKLYLETNPTLKFIEKQKAEVKRKLDFIDEGFNQWAGSNPKEANVNNPKSKYNSLMGVKVLKAQLKTLNYLLSV